MKEEKFTVNPLRLAVALATSLASLVIAAAMIFIRSPLPAVVFLVIAIFFALLSASNGARLTVSGTGIERKPWIGGKTAWSWDEIAEVGVAGTKLFPKSDSGKPGEMYIYFSKRVLDDNERFEMVLKWPPKDRLYLSYTPERLRAVTRCWNGTVTEYNTRDEEIVK